MKQKRHTPEEIIKKLREAEGLIAAGKGVDGAVRAIGVSLATYQRWKTRYGGMKKDTLKRLRELEKENARRDAQSFWAACGICDAEVFRQVGGFDETYRVPSIEDIALGYKIRRAGHRIALDSSWQVKHLKQWTWRHLVATDITRRAIPWTILLLREGRLDNDLNIDTRSRWSALLVALGSVCMAGGFFSPWLLAVSCVCLSGAIFLNRRFYRFLAKSGGWLFALGAIPLHLLYYLAALFGYAAGRVIFFMRSTKSSFSCR